MPRQLVSTSTCESAVATAAEFGGKAKNLHFLSEHGLPVPAWFCITGSAWHTTSSDLGDLISETIASTDFESRASIRGASQKLRAAVLSLSISDDLEEAIEGELGRLPGSTFAVRSSATVEDSTKDSFAGQLDTYLHVSPENVLARIIECWASLYGERCLTYANRRGVDLTRGAVAVVVQQMVASSSAGIMFTADPSGRNDDLIITAGYGLGEGVVSDQVESDTYRLGSAGEWTDQVTTKTRQVVLDREAAEGIQLAPVPTSLADRAVLSPEQKSRLADLGRSIASLYESPQDIEWALDEEGEIYITQARTITTVDAPTAVYDNSNIVESYPGITLPLTFSHVRKSYETLFRNVIERLGIDERLVEENREIFEQLLGHIRGRIYYNLTSWYRMFALVPMSSPYLPVWEKMLGIDKPLSIRRRGVIQELPTMARIALRFSWGWFRISRNMAMLRRRFQSIRDRVDRLDLQRMDTGEILDVYDRLQDELLPHWDVTLLNDAYAFIASGLCRALLKRAGLPENRFIELIADGGDLESVGPVKSVLAMADKVRENPDLEKALRVALETDPDSAVAVLDGAPSLRRMFDHHLYEWGDRRLEELKLETRSFSDDPADLLKMVLRYSRSPVERRVDRPKESTLLAELSGRPITRAALRLFAAAARRSIRLRESSRIDRARAFGVVRKLLLAAGDDLFRTGVLDEARDILYLTVDEIADHAKASFPPAPELRSIVASQKLTVEADRGLVLPPRIELRGPVESYLAPEQSPVVGGASLLQGTGCAPGNIEAVAEVVLEPDLETVPSGKILVAPMTDPGWVFLMVSAAGLIVEKGSLLSHTAIVGRELGVPTIVGVTDATRLIRTGQLLHLNGSTGQINLQEQT